MGQQKPGETGIHPAAMPLREVVFEGRAHPGISRVCSACGGHAPVGVMGHTKREDFDPTRHAYTFVCTGCVEQIVRASVVIPKAAP
jgi:hypothetical protein